MLNYESEVEELLLINLSKKFGIKDKNILQIYLKLRFLLLYPKYQSSFESLKNQRNSTKAIQNLSKKIKIAYMKYLFQELNIIQYSYQDTPLYFSYQTNSLLNIYDSLEFDLVNYQVITSIGVKEIAYSYIFEILQEIQKEKSKQQKLIFLNKRFHVEIVPPFEIQGVIQDFTLLSEEDKIEKTLNEESSNVNLITEEILQDYLATHLELIEEGLLYIDKEYRLPDGRIDILAKDKENNLVIIEVKIKDDERLPWQCMYYPYALSKKYPNKKIRMVTIAPQYKQSLFVVLNTLNITMYSFDICIKHKEIKELKLKLIKEAIK